MNQVGLFQTLKGQPGSIRAGFIWQREVTDGINFTANWYRASLEGYLNLPWKILAYSYFEYAKTLGSNRDSVAGKYRNDNYYQAIFQLRRPITSWMNVIAGYNHISNPSNIQDYPVQSEHLPAPGDVSPIDNQGNLLPRIKPCKRVAKAFGGG